MAEKKAPVKSPAPQIQDNEAQVQTAQTPDPWEKVPVRLPRITGGNEQEYVSVNDYRCIIPRDGRTYMVPRCVAKELRRSERAVQRMYEHKDEMLEATRQSAMGAHMI